jgi:hypothetical protein
MNNLGLPHRSSWTWRCRPASNAVSRRPTPPADDVVGATHSPRDREIRPHALEEHAPSIQIVDVRTGSSRDRWGAFRAINIRSASLLASS